MTRTWKGGAALAAALAATSPVLATGGAAPTDGATVAAAFGARPLMRAPDLSPDGSHLVFIHPGDDGMSSAIVMNLVDGDMKPVTSADGKPFKFSYCGWSAADRLVCQLSANVVLNARRRSITRLFGVDSDGKNQISLGREKQTDDTAFGTALGDGSVVDWMDGTDGVVLMERTFVPKMSTGTLMNVSRSGLGVERVDTRNNAAKLVEEPGENVRAFFGDGTGAIRVMRVANYAGTGMLTGTYAYKYRTKGSHEWRPLSRVGVDDVGLQPVVIDGANDVAYAFDKKDGRDALYRVALDGSLKTDLVYADPNVDVDSVIEIGRRNRVIGISYITDQTHTIYFDPEYNALADKLAKALPKASLIEFLAASADEKKLLLRASSQSDPGHIYLLDRATNHMADVAPVMPDLAPFTQGTVRSIRYPAADGTMIPAYLTLPAGSDGKNLPALVMPHGGPSARDSDEFDYLSQFFAQRGFAVIQPEYRGSSGYGDSWGNWMQNNAFKNWRTAIADVNAAGHWLVAQGVADPARLAIFGWSYGGYAALQANIVEPALFKAAIAVAPVTDLAMARDEHLDFADHALVVAQIGTGDTALAGSPDRHANQFQAPVLMFHGDQDLTVNIAESRAMDAALRHAGKQSRLVVYPGLDHQLDDGKAEGDMLAQSDAFLRSALHIAMP